MPADQLGRRGRILAIDPVERRTRHGNVDVGVLLGHKAPKGRDAVVIILHQRHLADDARRFGRRPAGAWRQDAKPMPVVAGHDRNRRPEKQESRLPRTTDGNVEALPGIVEKRRTRSQDRELAFVPDTADEIRPDQRPVAAKRGKIVGFDGSPSGILAPAPVQRSAFQQEAAPGFQEERMEQAVGTRLGMDEGVAAIGSNRRAVGKAEGEPPFGFLGRRVGGERGKEPPVVFDADETGRTIVADPKDGTGLVSVCPEGDHEPVADHVLFPRRIRGLRRPRREERREGEEKEGVAGFHGSACGASLPVSRRLRPSRGRRRRRCRTGEDRRSRGRPAGSRCGKGR